VSISVLAIGLDDELFKDPIRARGNVFERQRRISELLKSYHLIVKTPRKDYREIQAGNLQIIPTNSFNKIAFLGDALKQALRLARRHRIDLVTVQDPFALGMLGMLLKAVLRVPLNVQIHCDYFRNPYWMKERWVHRLMVPFSLTVLRAAESIRVGTRREKKKLEAAGIPAHKLYVVPVATPIDHFERADGSEVRRQFLTLGYKQLLLFVGRLVYPKQLQVLLRSVQLVVGKFPETLLLLIGAGDQEAELKRIVQNMGIDRNVAFLGQVPHAELPKFYAASDVFVLTSGYEGTCLVLVEAAAAGKPIVTTDIAGADDVIINGKSGFVVDVGDYTSHAERVLFLLEHPDIAARMGEHGRCHVRSNFDPEENIRRLVNMWMETKRGGGM